MTASAAEQPQAESKTAPTPQEVSRALAAAITAQDPSLVPEVFRDMADLSEGRGRLALIANSVGPLCTPPLTYWDVMRAAQPLVAQARGEQTPPL